MANILIADDEPSVRTFVSRVVENTGHTAIAACDGRDALEKFKTNQIDLSFVDVNMPEFGGIAFLEKAKEIDTNAVVIIMTGFPSAETIIETIEDDGYTYIAKPLRIDQIQDLILRGLETRKDLLNEA